MKAAMIFFASLLNRTGFIGLVIWIIEKIQIQKRGGICFPAVRHPSNRVFQILMYHRINDDPDGGLPATPVNVFARQMEYLATHYVVFTLEEIVDRLRTRDIPERAVVVTLDDGYRDNFTQAFPILRRLGVPATIFLATDAIGTGNLLWHDQVCVAISRTEREFLEGYGSSDGHSLTSSHEKFRAMEKVLWYLRSLDNFERVEQMSELIKQLGVSTQGNEFSIMLGWEDIRAMRMAGIRFGAHTLTHPILTQISDKEVRAEVRKSKEILETFLKEPVTSFAYPSGRAIDFNDRVKTIVEEEGFHCAVTTIPGVNSPGDDIFALRRMGFWDPHPGVFGLRMGFARTGLIGMGEI